MAKATDAEVAAKFAQLFNLSAAELAAWLETEESKSVGQDGGDGESIGRKSGKRVLAILRRRGKASAEDIAHMRRVVSFIARHRGQGPRRDIVRSRWRYALMNWGHDPLKPSEGDSPWR